MISAIVRTAHWRLVRVSFVLALLAACGSDATNEPPAEHGGSAGRGGGAGRGGEAARAGAGNDAGRSGDGADGGFSGDGGDAGGTASGAAGSEQAGRSNAGGGGEGAEGGSPEGGAGGVPEPAEFRLELELEQVTLPRGASAWIGVTVEREPGFSAPIAITFEDLPDGWASETLTLPAGVKSGILAVYSSPDAAEGAVELEAAASSSAQRATDLLEVELVPPEESSQEKIRAALLAGSIDYETSLRYRAFALWGDARLPETFLGAGSEEEDNLLFDELWLRLAGLSPEAQADLRPFVVRPHAAESIFNAATVEQRVAPRWVWSDLSPGSELSSCPPESTPAGAWISRRAADPVRVWARCTGDAATDAESARLIEQTLGLLQKIYGPMTGLMGAPIEDQEGPDTAIDFYIVDGGAVSRRGELFRPLGLGSTYSDYPEIDRGASGFVTLPRSLLYTSRFHTTLIHEFFHVLAKAYNHTYAVRELSASNVYVAHWFPEAAAVWAAAHFDRVLAPWQGGRGAYLDAHRRFIDRFLPSELALTAPEPVPHAYSAYIWPYFVEQETQSANFMPQIWEGLLDVSTWAAADDAISLPYSFAEHFKDFALRNLNAEYIPGDPLPRNERHVALDEIFPDGRQPTLITGDLEAGGEFRQALPLPNLSARYVALTATANVRRVEFDFSDLQPEDQVDVQMLVRTIDGWVSKPLDLSGESRAVFCFDEGPTTASIRGSFQSVLLVVSNHAVRSDSEVSGELVVTAEETPCAPVWQGTVTMSYQYPTSVGSVAESSTAAVVFEFNDTAPASPFVTHYRLRSGTYQYDLLGDFSDRDPACQTREVWTGTMIPEPYPTATPGSSQAQLILYHLTTPSTYDATGYTLTNVHVTSDCNDSHQVEELDTMKALLWLGTPSSRLEVSEDGRTIQGSYDAPDGGGGQLRYTWNLAKVEE